MKNTLRYSRNNTSRGNTSRLFSSLRAQRPGFGAFAFAVIALQLWWWLGINPLFHSSPMPTVTTIATASVAALEQPDREALKDAQWQQVPLTWTDCCEARFFAVRMALPDWPSDSQDAGLIINLGADNYWAYVNGYPVRKLGTLAPTSYHGLRKGILRLPKDILRPTGNEALVLTARNSYYYTDVFKAYMGDYQAMAERSRWRQFVVSELRLINTVIPILIGTVALLLLTQARNRSFLVWLALLAMVWGARNGFYLWESFPFGDVARRSYYAWITNALPLAWFGFVHCWASSVSQSVGWTRALWLACLVWLIIGLASTAAIALQGLAGIELSETLTELFGVVVTSLAAVRMLQHLFFHPAARQWEAAVFLLCMTTFLIEMAQYFWNPFGHVTSAHAASLFLLAFVVAVIARNVRLFESMEAFNQDLNTRLQASEVQIRDNYRSLEAANRAATLAAERQRLLQDMHDGIGSSLVGLLAVVRGAPKDLDVVEQALTEALEDLRLIIDSLDSATDDLAIALGVFRSRIEPRLAAAGIETQWDFDDLAMGLPCTPARILQLYRILQEAIGNVLKHANATRITLSAVLAGPQDATQVQVQIRDNGRWREPVAGAAGHGLQSMERRAASLGGTVQVQPAESGTRVLVDFPLQPAATPTSAPYQN